MEFFKRAKVFRLKCNHQNKYLAADNNDETIRQSSNNTSTNTHWCIELVEGKTDIVRFRSCHTNKYLATTDEKFLTGVTGKKLAQRLRLDSTVEWEAIKEGQYIKLKSHVGTLLKANPWVPPWRNSVTHDVPGHWSASESMVLWIVDIVELDYNSNRGTRDDNGSRTGSSGSTPEVVKHTIDVDVASSNDDGSFRYKTKSKAEESGLKEEVSGSGRLSRLPSAETMTGLAINVAKITFKELNNTEFHVVLSSGQIKKLEKAVSVISANAKISNRGNKNLVNLEERLKTLAEDHKRATQELVEYTEFSSRRYEIRAELKKDAAKARELTVIRNELDDTLMDLKARREELLEQLEETESSIKCAEKSQADSQVKIEELISRINEKSEAFKIMEREQRSWQTRKFVADKTLERIEQNWLQVQEILSDFL